MKKIINGKLYNTETAKHIGYGSSGGLPSNDFRAFEEDLYITKNGQFFVAGSGGPMTHYAESNGNSTSGSSDIHLMTPVEAQAWAEEHMDSDEMVEAGCFTVEEG